MSTLAIEQSARRRPVLRRLMATIASAFVFLAVSMFAAPAASAGAYLQTWGPNDSYITLDINGSGTWVNGVTTGNWAVGVGSRTICNYQFAVTFKLANGSPQQLTGTRGGCVNGFAGAWSQFRIAQHLADGSQICGHMWRDGQYYRGPCGTIRR